MAKSIKKKKSPPTEEQQLKRQKASFKRKIRNMFTGAGFTYIATNDKECILAIVKSRSMPYSFLKTFGLFVKILFRKQVSWIISEPKMKR